MDLRALRRPLAVLAIALAPLAPPGTAPAAGAGDAPGPGSVRVFYGRGHPVVAGTSAIARARYGYGVALLEEALAEPMVPFVRVRALANLCAGYVGLGDDARAVEQCSTAVAANAADWRSLSNRGLAHLRRSAWREARCDFERARALAPGAAAPERGLAALRALGAGEVRCR